jgi:hypothetical protein
MSNDRSITYTENGIVYYRASSLGACPRALYASRKGYEPTPYPPQVLQAFQEGHEYEELIRTTLMSMGWHTYDNQKEVSFKCGKVVLIGHIDWMMYHPTQQESHHYVCDAKALSAENFKLWRTYGFARFNKYAWQLSMYNRATQAYGICMAVLNKETGELDVSFHEPKYKFVDMLERTLAIEEMIADKEGVAQPECSNPEGWFCPFNYLHDTMFDEVGIQGGMDQIRQNELWELAHAYESAKRQEARYKNQAAEILHNIEIKLRADERSARVRKTGATRTFNIARVTSRRTTIDKELLGQYLQGIGKSLTAFELSDSYSYVRVSAVRKKKDDGGNEE